MDATLPLPAPEATRRLEPETIEDLREIVADAVARRSPLGVEGAGSKRGLGQLVALARTLSTRRLSGILFYEPEELVLSARSGTPLAEIEALVAARGQRLDFEPIDYGPLHGLAPGGGTLGGMLATNLSGPRRIKAGAARDHVLGIRAVSGRGEIFQSGGRVVKNVTGYDLSKGMAGSYGTLCVLADVTMKVLPASATQMTLVLRDLDDERAIGVLAGAMGSAAEVSGAAHLPYGVAARVLGGELGRAAATLIRLEGIAPSVAARADHLARGLARVGAVARLETEASSALWRDVRDVRPFADGTQRPVWRVSLAPTQAPGLVMALRLAAGADAFYDWQGGLVWLRMEADAEAPLLRRLVAQHGGGHATLVRGSEADRRTTPVFHPQPPALARLSQRLKSQFDPAGVLNPGRMG